ncbi:MAG: ATP-binding protein [Cyanobacteria bacterium J06627_32]
MQITFLRSFQLRLMALVLLGILPPLWGTLWLVSHRATGLFRAEAQKNMAIRAEVLSDRVDHWHQETTAVLTQITTETTVANMDRAEQLPTMRSALQAAQADIDTVVTVDTQGNVVAEVVDIAGGEPSYGTGDKSRHHRNYRHQPWFQTALSGDENSRVDLSANNDPTVIFSSPILAKPTLVRGDRTAQVAQLQARLQALGYYHGTVDGIYAEETAQSVQRFRRTHHQSWVSGDVTDSVTWEAIRSAQQAMADTSGDTAGSEIRPSSSSSNNSAIAAHNPSSRTVGSDKAEDVEGVVMVEASLDDIRQAVMATAVSDSGYALVLDEKGQVLAHSDQSADHHDLPAALEVASQPVALPRAKDAQTRAVGNAKANVRSPLPQAASMTFTERPVQQLLHSAAQQRPANHSRARHRRIDHKQARHRRANLAISVPADSPLPDTQLADTKQRTAMGQTVSALPNLSQFPPVTALRHGQSGPLHFADSQGQHWTAHGKALSNGWSVMVLQPSAALSSGSGLFQRLSVMTAAIAFLTSAIALSLLSARLTRPMHRLSAAATAVSLGHLNQPIPVESQDEIGTLATAFKRVVGQLQFSFSQLADQNESLKRLDRLKDQFLANTSHELKTPLNGMIGIAESLLEGAAGPLTDAQQKNVAMIAASSHRLTVLVNDILDFSKLQNQQLSIQPKPIGIFSSVSVVLALSQPLTKNKSLTLHNRVPKDLPLVYADENRLQQILLNLVSNAIKFTTQGTVTLSAEVIDAAEGNPQQIAVSICDTGIGISPDRLEHIFQPFHQEDNTAHHYGGTGLGLSIVRHLIELHQGEIWVESTLGKGTTFTFTVPTAPAAQAEKTTVGLLASGDSNTAELIQVRSLRKRAGLSASLADIREYSSPAPAENTGDGTSDRTLNPNKFNILIVDDEPINVQVLRNHLSLENYSVTHALNGRAALDLLAQRQQSGQVFDLVVLDVMMPQMSGYEVCQQLRELYPAHELPVVMLTAKNQITDLVTGFRFGANDYMTKPFSKDELLTRIRSHLYLSKTNHAYGRFVPSEYLRFLKKESIVDVSLGDHVSKEMAVMFSDIRAFTKLSEGMTPQENFNFVNAYLKKVSPVIRNQNGFIVKYLGDGMMAVFPDGVDDAVAAGVEKLRSVAAYNHQRQAKGFAPIAVGIGIHFGHMMVGMVGESARMQGDAFSDNVNLTARIESLTKHYGVSMLISDRALAQLTHPERYQIHFLDRVIVKGRSEPISLYHVLDGESPQLIQQLLSMREAFSDGISHYQAGLFKQAHDCFKQVLVQLPNNKTAQMYCDRLQYLLENRSTHCPKHWDGIWRLTQK